MPRDSRTHQAVRRQTKANRASAAKARRGTLPSKAAAVTILRATDDAGATYTLAVAAADPDRAYIVRPQPDGTYTCSCFNYRFSVRHTCAHIEAAAAAQEGC